MDNDFAPCPFCKHTGFWLQLAQHGPYSHVQCEFCGARGPNIHPAAPMTKEEAIQAWNERIQG